MLACSIEDCDVYGCFIKIVQRYLNKFATKSGLTISLNIPSSHILR